MSSRLRANGEKPSDLELRLAPLFLSEEGALTSSFVRGPPELIIIEDDDEVGEEELMHAPISSSRETRSFFPCPSSSVPISEEDLDLRLGVGASDGSSMNGNDKETSGAKCREATKSQFMQEFSEVKLRCAICMDSMKEETSTLCGHIFCKPCILNTILAFKRCPTCRKELSLNSIHRIFLPGANS